MVSRRILRVLVGCVLLAGAGCSYLPYALPDIGSSLANPVHDFWFRHKLDVAADEAWRKVVDHCGGRPLSSGYAEGFHTGYVDYVEGGGDGIPPTTPPYCLRCDVLRSPDRQQLIVDYYAGYKQGADVARFEGLRELVVVPLGRGPQPTSVGIRRDLVSKDDPRQPDPYGPSTLPPGVDTAPKGAQNALTPITPQELPAPRMAPNPPATTPEAPAVVPLPILPVAPPKTVPPAPTPLDPNKLPRLQPEPEPEKPMPEPQSRLRPSQAPFGNGSPRPMAVVPPPYAPVPIQTPPTVVPVMAIPGEEAEPSTPRLTVAPVPSAVKPIAVPTPISLPELPAVAPAAMPIPTLSALPELPTVTPAAASIIVPTAAPAIRPVNRPVAQPVAEPAEGPVTGTADGLDDDQPGETRGTTSTRDLDGLRLPAVPSSSEDDDDR
ncbi:MAG TPA: hypothetical protein VHR72_05155 [Gemmataceae bacterium]|jgi:hypothetical protein|nr:hypothetical protein [Gemmataceae bacterium]